MGYAIFKTANLLTATRHFAQELKEKGQPAYDIKSATIVLVTDGLQDPSPLDKGNRLRTIELDDAAAYAKSQGIRLYLINIDPQISTSQFAPHRRQMQRITELTGGQLYLLNEPQELQQIYAAIDQLEKGSIQIEGTSKTSTEAKSELMKTHYDRFSLSPFLIAIGLLSLFSAIILETTWLRRVP